MKILLFTFYFDPDLSAGSFRAKALAKALANKVGDKDSIEIITTTPNRYSSFLPKKINNDLGGKIKMHRISVPEHSGGMFSQIKVFVIFSCKAIPIVFSIKPDFVVGTSGRLMTGFLTYFVSKVLRVKYFIDIRDIFPEAISDVFREKSKIISFLLNKFFSKIEKVVIKNAVGVNVVSAGFFEYFQKNSFSTEKWFNHPNGIDHEFIEEKAINILEDKKGILEKTRAGKKIVVYAGNIGHGQGLENTVPYCAKELESSFHFIIIGDGGTKEKLVQSLTKEKVKNVELIKPMNREELLKYYALADVLFLQLNDYKAFYRVLPSKIFEYASLGKPIVAGVAGFAAFFLRKEVRQSLVFPPNDFRAMAKCLLEAGNASISKSDVDGFIFKFSRNNIMRDMSTSILESFQLCQS